MIKIIFSVVIKGRYLTRTIGKFLVKTSQSPPPQIPWKVYTVQTLTHRDYFIGVRKVTECDTHKPDKKNWGKMLTNLCNPSKKLQPPNFLQTMWYAVLNAKLCLLDQCCSVWSICPSFSSGTDVAHGLIVLVFLGLMVEVVWVFWALLQRIVE